MSIVIIKIFVFILKIDNSATWKCKYTDIEDPKLFLYLTTTSLNIKINLI